MAKKKTETPQVKRQEPVKPAAEVDETKVVETVGEAEESKEETVEEPVRAEEPAKQPEPEKVEAVEKDIPSDALRVLKAFNDMEYLYIGKGGVFRDGTPESVRGKAVLYKNPYFKNNKN